MAVPARIAPKQLLPLTSLRLFAAGMIFLHHLRGKWGVPSEVSAFPLGQGVSFFFVLSGFILTYAYREMHDKNGMRSFLVARASRLYPLHIFTFLAVLALFFEEQIGQYGWSGALINVSMLQAWWPSDVSLSFNGPSWSISNEIFFYLVFPFLLLGLRRINAIFLGYLFLTVLFFRFAPEILPRETFQTIIHVHPLIRILEFIFGMALARLYLARPRASWNLTAGTAIETASLAILVTVAVFSLEFSRYFADIAGDGSRQWFMRSGMFPLYGLVILVFAYESGWLSKFLSHPFLVLGGEISFSLYMIHQIVIRFFTRNDQWFAGLSNGVIVTLIVVIAFALSYLSWRFLETPFRHKLTKSDVRLRDELRKAVKGPGTPVSAICLVVVAGVIAFGLGRGYVPTSGQIAAQVTSESPSDLAGLSYSHAGLTLQGVSPARRCGVDVCLTLLWRIDDPETARLSRRFIRVIDQEGRRLEADNAFLAGASFNARPGVLIRDELRLSHKAVEKSSDGGQLLLGLRSNNGMRPPAGVDKRLTLDNRWVVMNSVLAEQLRVSANQ